LLTESVRNSKGPRGDIASHFVGLLYFLNQAAEISNLRIANELRFQTSAISDFADLRRGTEALRHEGTEV